jgi:beta-glucosidase
VNGTAAYSEGLQVGYRWYDAQKVAPLFPFGYGLSYTTFSLRNLSVSPVNASTRGESGQLSPENLVSVGMDVTNTGSRPGADVVQVYIAAPAAAGEPPKQLKGFTKVNLQPGQTQHVLITLDPRAFSVWDTTTNKWTVIPGEYGVLVGDSSADLPLHASITVKR